MNENTTVVNLAFLSSNTVLAMVTDRFVNATSMSQQPLAATAFAGQLPPMALNSTNAATVRYFFNRFP